MGPARAVRHRRLGVPLAEREQHRLPELTSHRREPTLRHGLHSLQHVRVFQHRGTPGLESHQLRKTGDVHLLDQAFFLLRHLGARVLWVQQQA